jgi:hypothetical protein
MRAMFDASNMREPFTFCPKKSLSQKVMGCDRRESNPIREIGNLES